MNKKKSSKASISNLSIGVFLLAALFVIACGVNYAMVKNEQVAVDRKVDKVRQEMQRSDIETQSILVQVDRKVNRFAVKSEMREIGSIMRERPDFVVERVGVIERPIVHLAELEVTYPNLVLDFNHTSVSTN